MTSLATYSTIHFEKHNHDQVFQIMTLVFNQTIKFWMVVEVEFTMSKSISNRMKILKDHCKHLGYVVDSSKTKNPYKGGID